MNLKTKIRLNRQRTASRETLRKIKTSFGKQIQCRISRQIKPKLHEFQIYFQQGSYISWQISP